MKFFAFSLPLLICVAANSVYAADTAPTVTNTSTTGQSEQSIPQGTATLSKTREQVYQELKQAQQSGQLTQLNKTVYRAN